MFARGIKESQKEYPQQTNRKSQELQKENILTKHLVHLQRFLKFHSCKNIPQHLQRFSSLIKVFQGQFCNRIFHCFLKVFQRFCKVFPDHFPNVFKPFPIHPKLRPVLSQTVTELFASLLQWYFWIFCDVSSVLL